MRPFFFASLLWPCDHSKTSRHHVHQPPRSSLHVDLTDHFGSSAGSVGSADTGDASHPESDCPPDPIVLVAVQLEMPLDWHTYWSNPSDGNVGGMASSVRWELPAGITAGPVRWPIPHKISEQDAHVYAYEGRMALIVPPDHCLQRTGRSGNAQGPGLLAGMQDRVRQRDGRREYYAPDWTRIGSLLDRQRSNRRLAVVSKQLHCLIDQLLAMQSPCALIAPP